MLEVNAYKQMRAIIDADYDTFTGKRLEAYFKEKLIEQQTYTRIGNWWSRNGEDEIDLIAINELDKTADFYEIKRNPDAYNKTLLQTRIDIFLQATRQLKGYQISQHGLSMNDI